MHSFTSCPTRAETQKTAWQNFFLDFRIDIALHEFVHAVDEYLRAFCARTPRAEIGHHTYRIQDSGLALCYQIGGEHYLWMSVLPSARNHRVWRATVSRARRIPDQKAEGAVLCGAPRQASDAITAEIMRTLKLAQRRVLSDGN